MRGSEHHYKLTNGVGKCSVPMWYGGGGECFCDAPAYGERPEPEYYYRDGWTGERRRSDGRYNGYVPGLACVGHGGPEPKRHQGDPCVHCSTPHDEAPPGPCRGSTSSQEAEHG